MLKIFFPKENNRIQISSDARGLDNFFVNFFSIFFLKKVMAMFEVDFIFCCPCLVSNIFDSRFMGYKKFFEFTCFVHRRNPKKVFDIDSFKKDSSLLITCFEHLCSSMYFGKCVCLHYNRATFYHMIVENMSYPIRKCYSCYRRSTFQGLLFEIKMRIDFVSFSNDAISPSKGLVDAAGFDLYSVEEVINPPSNDRIV